MRNRFTFLLTSLLLCISSLSALAQQAGLSPIDPFRLQTVLPGSSSPNLNTNGLTLRASQSLNPAVRNLILVVLGQSNLTDIAPSLYSPANPTKIDVFNVYDGGLYPAVDPLLSCSLSFNGGNPALRLADQLITANLFDRVVIACAAVGGTSIANWDTGFTAPIIPAMFGRLKAKGLVTGTNVTVATIFGQGEEDTLNATSQAAYTTGLTDVIAAIRAWTSGPIFVASESWYQGFTAANVTNGQAAVINHSNGVWAGPNADAIVNNTCSGSTACRQADNIHFSDIGSVEYAGNTRGWQAAMHLFGSPF